MKLDPVPLVWLYLRRPVPMRIAVPLAGTSRTLLRMPSEIAWDGRELALAYPPTGHTGKRIWRDGHYSDELYWHAELTSVAKVRDHLCDVVLRGRLRRQQRHARPILRRQLRRKISAERRGHGHLVRVDVNCLHSVGVAILKPGGDFLFLVGIAGALEMYCSFANYHAAEFLPNGPDLIVPSPTPTAGRVVLWLSAPTNRTARTTLRRTARNVLGYDASEVDRFVAGLPGPCAVGTVSELMELRSLLPAGVISELRWWPEPLDHVPAYDVR